MIWLLALALCFGLVILVGAPYLPVLGKDVEEILDLAGVKAGSRVVDLGSGDGRLLVAVARRGGTGVGYEINPVLWLVSVMRTWPYRRQLKLRWGNFWRRPLPACDVVYVFLIGHFMSKLDAKLAADPARPFKLVSYSFKLPDRQPVSQSRNAWLYEYQ